MLSKRGGLAAGRCHAAVAHAVERGKALHCVLTGFKHPFLGCPALKHEVQLTPSELALIDCAVKTVERVADAAADIVPVYRRRPFSFRR